MFIVDLSINQKAKITNISGSKTFQTRLKNLGVKIGDLVMLKKVSPFNDPIEIEVNGFLLAMRKENAKRISVELI